MGSTYPADDSDKTWHVHDDGSWDWGINCEVCHSGRSFDVVPYENFNIERLKEQNAEGYTVNEMVQEHYAHARATGQDITRA